MRLTLHPWRGEIGLLILILTVAAAVRIGALVEVRELGFFRHPLSDGRVYVDRARGIVAGDWVGPADFVHAPLYAYFLAVVAGLAGDYVWAPRIAQTLLGVATVALVYVAARRLFRPPAALVAAAIVALYAPAIFFDTLIQKASLTHALTALTLATSVWAATAGSRTTWLHWGVAGFVLGILVLNRQHALVYLPLVALWALLAPAPLPTIPPRPRRPTRARIGGAAAVLVGCGLALAPWIARNRVVLREWVLTTPNLGQNLAMGVGPGATGTYRAARSGFGAGEREQIGWTREAETALGRKLTAGEVSDYYLRASLEWIRNNPSTWLRQLAWKIGLVWGLRELPDTEDYYLYIEHSRLLNVLNAAMLNFGLLAPLAVVGIFAKRKAASGVWPLHVWLLLTTISVAAFVVFGRYRLPLIPVLAIFAGAGVMSIVERLRARRAGGILAHAGLLAILVGALCWPSIRHCRPQAASYCNHAVALAEERRFDEALAELDRARALAPSSADVHYMYGATLLDLGRPADALRHFTQARDSDPNYAAAWRGVGDALIELGRGKEAIEVYDRALQTDPDDAISMNCLGAAFAREGQYDAGIHYLHAALRLRPDYAEAYLNLGNTYLALGQAPESENAYARAIELRPDYVDAWFNRGLLALQRNQPAQAATCFETVLTYRPTHGVAQCALVEALMRAGAPDRARAVLAEMLRKDPERGDLLQIQRRIGPPPPP